MHGIISLQLTKLKLNTKARCVYRIQLALAKVIRASEQPSRIIPAASFLANNSLQSLQS
jgi:hypothetical protein